MVAIDRDAGENGRVSYTILSGNLNDTFDINRSTGALFTTREVRTVEQQRWGSNVRGMGECLVSLIRG